MTSYRIFLHKVGDSEWKTQKMWIQKEHVKNVYMCDLAMASVSAF